MSNYRKKRAEAPPNRFVDNWLYMQEFTLDLQPATPAQIAGDVTHLLMICRFYSSCVLNAYSPYLTCAYSLHFHVYSTVCVFAC